MKRFGKITLTAAVAGLLLTTQATMPVPGTGSAGSAVPMAELVVDAAPRRVTLDAAARDAAFMGPLPLAASFDFAAQARLAQANTPMQADVMAVAAASEDDATVPATTGSLPAAARAKMSGPVAALARYGGNEPAEIIVSYAEYPELFENDRVASLGGEVVRRFGTFDMMAVRLPADSLVELAIEDSVSRLSLDDEVRSMGAEKFSANLPLAGSANAGYRGGNIGIAVIDTGISQHADLPMTIRQYSFLNGRYPQPVVDNGSISSYNDDQREDLYGHGTHVAGIIAGDGSDSAGEHTGPADQAELLSLQVLDGHGRGSTSDVLAALDWLAQYGSYFDIRVVNLSLGQGVTESIDTDPMVAAAEALWHQGMVVVVAAGNYGRAGDGTVMSPANSRKVITVGSLTDNGTGNDVSDDYVSTFSSRGPTWGDLVMKPDLLAPGNRLVAAIPKQAQLRDDLPGRIVACTAANCGDEYFELSGTSMAAPMVSAAAAMMLEKEPWLTPATVKARLMRSARKIDAAPTAAGAGVLDVDAALNETGVISGEALSPLMVPDATNGGVFIEDTAELWGGSTWGAGYLWTGGFTWASGFGWTDAMSVSSYLWTDGGGVGASGFGWTDGIEANGFGWTDGIEANGFGWTDGAHAFGVYDLESATPSLLDDENTGGD